jgi:hypothetical protein
MLFIYFNTISQNSKRNNNKTEINDTNFRHNSTTWKILFVTLKPNFVAFIINIIIISAFTSTVHNTSVFNHFWTFSSSIDSSAFTMCTHKATHWCCKPLSKCWYQKFNGWTFRRCGSWNRNFMHILWKFVAETHKKTETLSKFYFLIFMQFRIIC